MAYRGRPSAVGRWRSDRAHPEPLWLLRSVIVVSIFIGPGWLLEQQVRFTRRGSTKMTKTITRTAGIDTSKAKLDVALHGGECWQVANAASGWRSLARKLAGAGVARVGIEATGGYERGVVGYLRESGLRFSSCSRSRSEPMRACTYDAPRTMSSMQFSSRPVRRRLRGRGTNRTHASRTWRNT